MIRRNQYLGTARLGRCAIDATLLLAAHTLLKSLSLAKGLMALWRNSVICASGVYADHRQRQRVRAA